jgi:hypothetical protein
MPSEFIVLAGMVIVGLILFLIVEFFITGEEGTVSEYGYKAEAEGLVSLIGRVSSEPNNYVLYCQYVSPCDIIVKNGVLTYENDKVKYSFPVPKSVNVTNLKRIATVCILKSGNTINLLSKKPVCVVDGFCTPDECKENCPDCYNQFNTCKDGFCNKNIGENCENSDDCKCTNGVCCSNHPDADERGCLIDDLNLNKGDECYCDGQCSGKLKCNPTVLGFTSFAKACCEAGKSWDGNQCIVTKCEYPCVPGCILPDSFDWHGYKGKNWMSPIRRQKCGDCWAFSAAGTVEAKYNIEQNNPDLDPDLSEQDLVSCSGAGTCNGGWHYLALSYIKTMGICDEGCFPEVGADLPCSDKCSDWRNRLWKINSYFRVTETTDEIKRALICNGPLSVTVTVVGPDPDHAVVLTGYDDNNPDCKNFYGASGCWIIKNSWGVFTGWDNYGWAYHINGYAYTPYYDIGMLYGVKDVSH